MSVADTSCLFGAGGKAVGSLEGDWLFDVNGKAVAYKFDGGLYDLQDAALIGSARGGVIYDRSNRPLVQSRNARTGLLDTLRSRLRPSIPRLRPGGPKVSGQRIGEEHLLPYVLCDSLDELKAKS